MKNTRKTKYVGRQRGPVKKCYIFKSLLKHLWLFKVGVTTMQCGIQITQRTKIYAHRAERTGW